ncbi:hypothetical protein [Parasitella parasitica]|uniref:Uncharacterized protein n=1 Tax=Parasitella parasitica TaxID=35722 RepID=A0A0B7NQG6_9FUNG|nr:hypothetical protein [Parasitella parasitica]
MPRAATILAGITLATVLTYQSRINLITSTAHVQAQLDKAKENADLITHQHKQPLIRLSLQRPTSSIEQFMDNTKSYYKGRLLPSVKESWNAHVTSVTLAIIQSNLPAEIVQFVATNVFGCRN